MPYARQDCGNGGLVVAFGGDNQGNRSFDACVEFDFDGVFAGAFDGFFESDVVAVDGQVCLFFGSIGNILGGDRAE